MKNSESSSLIRLCGEFSRAIEAGESPNCAHYLPQIEHSQRRQLLAKLLALESAHLPPERWQKRLEQYRTELSEFGEVLDTFDTEWETLNTGVGHKPKASHGPEQPLSEWIGRFRIIEVIGEGGMGCVYRAEQEEPVRRSVALKVIRAGLNSSEIIARFEAERQALAMMDHPSIARILDAGTTEQGQPYFAMELVQGIALTDYCDQNRLDIPQRLDIFKQICEGIQQAHQKGIVHRDLKPSNILVTEFNGKPQPKIIDFGLAKALDTTHKLTDKTMFTEFGQVLGTLKYMSPEQAGLNALDIDTRSDVYTLGVILYELLTGSTPIDDDSLGEQAIIKILELVREKEGPRPSSRLSGIGESVRSITSARRIDGRELVQILSGDLDWIVMKAIDKDRDRRYGSASALSDDVQCFLSDEPVSARPPSSAYRLRKFVKKNRALAVSTAAICLSLLLGVAAASYGMLWALKEKGKADASLIAAKQLVEEKAALADQKSELANLNQTVVEYFVSAFRSADPAFEGVTHETTALEVLLKALERINTDSELAKNRLTKATLLEAIGESLKSLGALQQAKPADEEALRLRKEVLGPNHTDTLRSMNHMANSHAGAGELDEALALYLVAFEERKRILGKEHPETLLSASNLGMCYRSLGQFDKAIAIQKEVLDLRIETLGRDHPDTLSSRSALGVGYHAAGQFEAALPNLEEALRTRESVLGVDHPETLVSRSLLASLHQQSGNTAIAIELEKKTLAMRKAKLGPDHPNTLTSMFSLANGYRDAGQLIEALPLYERTLDLRKSKLGAVHPDTLSCQDYLGHCFLLLGRNDEGIALVEECYRLRKSKLGEDHPDTLLSMNHLAMCYTDLKRYDEATELFEKTLALQEESLGIDHPHTLATMNNLAVNLRGLDRFTDAVVMLREVLRRQESKFGNDHPNTLANMSNLSVVLAQSGDLDNAMRMKQEVYQRSIANLGENHPDTITRLSNLAIANYEAKEYETGLELLEEVLERRRSALGVDHPSTLNTMHYLAFKYVERDREEEGLKLCEERLGHTRKKWGAADPKTVTCVRHYAIALRMAGKFEEALPRAEELVRLQTSSLGSKHPDTLSAMSSLAYTYKLGDQVHEALPIYEETLRLRRATLGEDHLDTISSINKLAYAYETADRLKDALPLFEEVLRLRRSSLGADHSDTQKSQRKLAAVQTKLLEASTNDPS